MNLSADELAAIEEALLEALVDADHQDEAAIRALSKVRRELGVKPTPTIASTRLWMDESRAAYRAS